MNKISKKQWARLTNLLVSVALIISVLGYFAYKSEQDKRKRSGKTPYSSVLEFLGLKHSATFDNIVKGILTSMVSNVVFGFIDNGGLWFGMDALDPFMDLLPGVGKLTKAGLGNTFSDAVGAFAGTFAGIIIKNKVIGEDEDIPEVLWAEAIGIIIGCLLGIAIPRYLTNKK